jgi:2-polyprenyl-6-hydroxyphenyl methylase/3-demethylubiquinone-9 3-methyltransferase
MPAEHDYTPFPNQEWRNTLQSQVEIRLAARLLHVPKGLRLLEVGCGRGIALEPISRICEPRSLTGLDIEPQLIAEARNRAQQLDLDVTLVAGDVRQMPFASASFDLVVDFGTCYHVAGRREAIAEVQRVLAPGGLFFYESPLSQALAHPTRTTWRRLPWRNTGLRPIARAGLWSARVKLSRPG